MPTARRTLEKLPGIPRSSFYRWYEIRHQRGGPEALASTITPHDPDQVWNRIPEAIRRQIIDLAAELTRTEPAGAGEVRFLDEQEYRRISGEALRSIGF